MPQLPKRKSIPVIPDNLPMGLYELLDAIVSNYQIDKGDFEIVEKRPTINDLIDAGVTNADKIT